MPTDRVAIHVFREKGFPAYFGDEASVDVAQVLSAAWPKRRVRALALDEMAEALREEGESLAVFATGCHVPLDLWPVLRSHAERGGHLLWLGGPPLETALARRERGRFTREGRDGALRAAFGIAAVAEVERESIARHVLPAEGGENPFDASAVASIPLEPSYALVIASSDEPSAPRVRTLHALVHGIGFDGLVRSAPVVSLDRLRGPGAGGRAVFVTLAGRRLEPLAPVLPALAEHAMRGASELLVEPELATYYAGEKPAVRVTWRTPGRAAEVRLRIRVQRDERGEPVASADAVARSVASGASPAADFRVSLPFEAAPGLYRVFADVTDTDGRALGSLRTGFYGFDEDLLARQPRLRADGRYFFGNEPEAVPLLGATYHDAEWGELFFLHPNPDRWERDFADLRAIGLNSIRTGLRSGWLDVMGEDHMFREESLRAFDAFFHAAAAHGIHVLFTLFSVVPDAWSVGHPYLAQSRIAYQRTFVEVISRRFRDHKHVSFDLVDGPSFSSRRRPCGEALPYGDAEEREAWAKFLESRHGEPSAVARAWERTRDDAADFAAFPPPGRSSRRSAGSAIDFRFFAEEAFTSWADAMAGAIRKKGRHLVTIAQGAAEATSRPSPAFFHPAVDFTVAETRGDDEDLLFEVLASRMPQKPCVVGEPFEPAGGRDAERSATPLTEKAARDRLERKVVIALVASAAGVIDGEWHADPGAVGRLRAPVRSDGSFSPEVDVFASVARFLRTIAPFVGEPRPEDVFVVLSHSAVFHDGAALRSARRSVRAFQQQTGREASVVPEGRVKDVGRRRLFVLPSVGRLSETAWKALLRAVRGGSRLLVSGPVGRDEYGADRARLSPFEIDASPVPVSREELFRLGRRPLGVRFDEGALARTEKDVVNRRGRSVRRRGDLFDFDHGLGKVLYSTLPFEANGSRSALGALYEFACRWAGVETVYRVKERDPGVVVRAVIYGRSRLYGIVSETSEVRAVEVLDRTAGVRLKTFIEPGRANLILVRDSGEIIKMRDA